MIKAISLFLSAFVFVSTMVPLTVSAEDDYPYNIEHYRDLGIDDAQWCSFSYSGDLIVFTSMAEKPDNSSIWVAKVDGTGRHMLCRNSSIHDSFSGPKFSPDDKKIVFTKLYIIIPGEKGEISIDILEKNGTNWDENCNNITIYKRSNSALGQPSFSPDGEKIIYFSNEAGGDGDVWVMDIDGTNRTRLTFDQKGGMNPSYSRDGKKIVYNRWSKDGEYEIWVMNSDGTDGRRVCDDSWYPDRPSFMFDGKILFESARYSPHSKEVGAPSIWMMDQDGGNKVLLAPYFISSIGSDSPSISHNGTKIIFENNFGDDFTLYIVEDPDGNGIWEDSDGDGVADICDGYPDDPKRGYIKDDNDSPVPAFGFETVTATFLIATTAAARRKVGVMKR